MRTSFKVGAVMLACTVVGVAACGRSKSGRGKTDGQPVAKIATLPVSPAGAVTPAVASGGALKPQSQEVVKAGFEDKHAVVLGDDKGGFALNDIWLSKDARKKIDGFVAENSRVLRTAHFEIAGYTDILGTKAANDRVGLARAEAAKQYLCDKYGISEDQINVVSRGADDPVGDNTTDDGRALNRRVVIKVVD